jgi:transposase
MPRATTPSFVLELPLIVDSASNRELEARFNAGLRLYNACLNEAQKRLKEMRVSTEYQAACKLPNKSKARRDAFVEVRSQYRFTDFDMQSFANLTAKRSKWIAEKVDAQAQQTLATRAFKAVEKVAFGKAKKVRFKVPNRFSSMEGKTNKQGIRWQNDQFVWGKLKLTPMIDWENPVHLHGLSSKIKYVRIIRRNLNGKTRWFVQLVCEGIPFQKPQNFVTEGLVGLDLNISNVAYVADNKAGLMPFAENVPTYKTEIKAIQRKMQRSQRSNNPECFEPDFDKQVGRKIVRKKGKFRKGKKVKVRSQNYRRLASRKRELERRKAAYAKSQNRQLVNEILRHGNNIKTENVSVKGWQKRYGKAIAAKSPGYFQAELKRKAESAGGSFIKFSTQKTACSQTHLTGNRIKKSLSERVHNDETGIVMHRDLFSAYLSRFVSDDKLAIDDAASQYQGSESILQAGWQEFKSLSGKALPNPGKRDFGSGSHRKDRLVAVNAKAGKAVA